MSLREVDPKIAELIGLEEQRQAFGLDRPEQQEWLGGSAASNAVINAVLNGAPIVAVGGTANRPYHRLFVQPDINRLEDLKGKTLGVTRFGSPAAGLLPGACCRTTSRSTTHRLFTGRRRATTLPRLEAHRWRPCVSRPASR